MRRVKITSLAEKAIALLAPHYCYGCRAEGALLCDGCLETVVENDMLHCSRCLRPTTERALCADCLHHSPLSGLFVASSYGGAVELLIHGYKFERARAAHSVLTTLLNRALPYLDDTDIVVVPIPTSARHQRVRGYDHTRLLARELARRRDWRYHPGLERLHQLRQIGASHQVRNNQAKTAFKAKGPFDGGTVVLVDDVVTSGATLTHAAHVLREAGADRVIAVAVAQQRLT